MFNVAGQGGSSGEDLSYRANILSTVYKDLSRIRPKLSEIDAKRLDQHMEAVHELEEEINNKPPVMAGCNIPTGLSSASGYEDQSAEFAKLAAIAFNCDLTRIISSMFGHPFDGISAYNLNTHENRVSNWHQATHGLGGSTTDISNFISAVLKYRADVFLKVLEELDAFSEPAGGSLLDHTIVHWFTESISDHKYQDCFNLIGGGAGYFKMGKQCVVGGSVNKNNNAPLNMLLTSIGQAMGFNINNFGSYSKGPIPAKYLA